jgi:hypothetical protein
MEYRAWQRYAAAGGDANRAEVRQKSTIPTSAVRGAMETRFTEQTQMARPRTEPSQALRRYMAV